MKNFYLWMLVCLSFSVNSLMAQDIHFSQFFAAPYHLNPAQTGDFMGNYRFIGNHRTQWRSVTTPYQTYAIAADARDIAQVYGLHPGISIYNDKAGDSRFGTFQCNFSLAYDLLYLERGRKKLSLGGQIGFTQRSLNPSALTFDKQFVGDRFDPSNGSGENFARNRFAYLNLAGGISYAVVVDHGLKFSTGFAVYNLSRPGQSFYRSENINLDPRFTIFGRSEIALNDDWALLPSVMGMFQGKFKEILVGSGARYHFNIRGNDLKSVTFGTWFRMGDAGFVMVGADYRDVNIGLSYDFNFSGLVPASNYRGGFELSLIYILKNFEPRRPVYKYCPSFI